MLKAAGNLDRLAQKAAQKPCVTQLLESGPWTNQRPSRAHGWSGLICAKEFRFRENMAISVFGQALTVVCNEVSTSFIKR
jgi:hypothetical protein